MLEYNAIVLLFYRFHDEDIEVEINILTLDFIEIKCLSLFDNKQVYHDQIGVVS